MFPPVSARTALLRQRLFRATGPVALLALLATPSLALAHAEPPVQATVVVVAPDAPQLVPDCGRRRASCGSRP